MKVLVVLSALVFLAAGQETYNTDNDNLDIDAVISSPEALKSWFNCFVDKGPCDNVQTAFKTDIGEAIQQACAKCTDAQKVLLKKFVGALKDKAPADYETFKKKFDPEDKYLALAVLAAGQETYSTDNDNLDIDAVVSSPEALKSWFNCFVDKGPCDNTQTAFKTDIGEAIQQACAKCTDAQKVLLKKFLGALKDKAPADYETFKEKFDPEDKYFGPLAKAIA